MKAPKNGPLTDQGERVGKIGRSSYTYADTDTGNQAACVAVTGAHRIGERVVVTVRVVNHGSTPCNLDVDWHIDVSLAYGTDGLLARSVGDDVPLAGVVPPGATRTGRYGFTVPAPNAEVSVTAGPSSVDQGVWTGRVS